MNLTPTEQAEVVRFGIHDREILAVMEDHADDVTECYVCERTAELLIVCRFCRVPGAFLCSRCEIVIAHVESNTRFKCEHCSVTAIGWRRSFEPVQL